MIWDVGAAFTAEPHLGLKDTIMGELNTQTTECVAVFSETARQKGKTYHKQE